MSFVKDILKWLIIFLVVFIIPFVSYLIYSKNFDWISYVADFVTILGLGGIIWEYSRNKKIEAKNKKEEQLRAIKSIKYQLEIIGRWTNYDFGGYMQETRSLNKKDWSSLGKIVYEIEGCSIENISSLPAIKNFDDSILESIANVNQGIRSFNTMVLEIRTYRNLILIELKKLEGEQLEKQTIKFQVDIYSMFKILHEDIISNDRGKGLYFWHKKLTEQIGRIEDELKNKLN